MRAVLYLRVSTGEQGRKFSLAAQESELRAHALERGIEIVEVVQEMGSGIDWRRQSGLLSLIELAGNGDFDSVLVTERDRLTRDPDGMAIFRYLLARKGVQVLVKNEPASDALEPAEELTDGIISLIARYESKLGLMRWNGQIVKAQHLPLVSEELWDKVRGLQQMPKKASADVRPIRHAGAGNEQEGIRSIEWSIPCRPRRKPGC
jgi:DNA invertase Pin-like site-specific DNA recombinase